MTINIYIITRPATGPIGATGAHGPVGNAIRCNMLYTRFWKAASKER